MAEGNDIPVGTYTLELGKSFLNGENKRNPSASSTFHTLRYDFKPSSVTNESETYIAYGNNGDVHVALPTEADNLTVFKGSKKEAKPKECLLFFDTKTKTVRLEKISSNIQVKKTRDLDSTTELTLRDGIERLRTSSLSQQPKVEIVKKPVIPSPNERKDSSSSSSSSSGSGSDSSSDDSDDENGKNASSSDDENALLEKMNATNPEPPRIAQSIDNSYQNMPNFEASSSAQRNPYRDHGLALSETSDEDD